MLGKKRVRITEKRTIRGFSSKRGIRPQRRPPTNSVRIIKTSDGNRITILPGVKPSMVSALIPSRWRNIVNIPGAGRTARYHGNVFQAQGKDAKGNIVNIHVRPIRAHYSTTHEARMLLKLRELGFETEQPLGILVTPNKERMIITKRVENGSLYGDKKLVEQMEKKLEKAGIDSYDLFRHGKQNYLYVINRKGKKKVVLIDVEHYSAKNKKSRLHASRMTSATPHL